IDTGRLTGTTPEGTPVIIGEYVVLLRSERALQDTYATSGSPATMIGYHNGRRIWRSTDLKPLDGDDAEVVDGQLLLTQVTRQVNLSLRPLARVDLQHGSITTLDTP